MAIKKSRIIFGAVALANLAMSAAICVKMFRTPAEEKTDMAVEEAGWPYPIGFDDEPEEDYEEVRDYCDEFDEQVEPMQEHETRREKDPFDEGIDNILRYAVNGKTGLEVE